MGSVGAPELIVIFLVALMVLGPERLPKAARQVGKAISEFKRVTGGFQDEVRKAMDIDGDNTPPKADPAAPAAGGPPSPSDGVPYAGRPASGSAGRDVDLPPPDDPSRN